MALTCHPNEKPINGLIPQYLSKMLIFDGKGIQVMK